MCLFYLLTHLFLRSSLKGVLHMYLFLIDWLSCHVGVAAFEVEDAAAMEARLVFFGIEYTKVYVPEILPCVASLSSTHCIPMQTVYV